MIRVLWFFIVTAVLYWALKELFSKDRGKDRPGAAGEEMVKDPSCGVYLPKSSAIPYQKGRQRLYFCSDKCLEEFKKGVRH